MRIYVAGPYQHKIYISSCAEDLRKIGIEVTSSWLEENHAPNTQLSELSDAVNTRYALADLRDIDRADAFVLFTVAANLPPIPRAGRHVEFGYALAHGLPIYVVGKERENIFHYLPGKVRHFDTWNELVDFFARHPRVMGA